MVRVKITKRKVLIALGVLAAIAVAVGVGVLVFLLQKSNSNPQPSGNDEVGMASPPAEFQRPEAVVEAQKLAMNGDPQKAQAALDEALKQPNVSNDDKYDLYIEQGVIYTNQNNPQKALEVFKLAEAVKKDFNVSHLIAEQYEALGDKANAIAYFKQSLALLDKNSPLYFSEKKIFEDKVTSLGGTL